MTPHEIIASAYELQDLVRGDADKSEENRHLSQIVAYAFAKNNLYRLAAPVELNGFDADACTQMRVIEAISEAGGAAGWNLMIGIETFGLVSPSMQNCQDMIADPMAIMASSTANVGKAEIHGNDYLVTGQWQFVSGIHNADVFGATVQRTQNGEPVDETLYYAMVPKGDYEIVDTWHVSGLRGSGSHDVKLETQLVPANRIVATIGQGSMQSNQLQVPLGVRLTFNKVAVALGIARAAIEAFRELAQGKTPRFSNRKLQDRPFAHRAMALAEARLRSARAGIYKHAEHVWNVCQSTNSLSDESRAITHVLASDSANAAVDAVDLLIEAAGTSANRLGTPLERLSRDVRVIRQHATVAPHLMEEAGRVLLGLEPRGILKM